MPTMQRFRKGFIPCLVIVGALLCLTSTAMAANFVVVANKNVQESSLSKTELQAIFLGEKIKWESKKYIKIAILENGAAYKEFLQSVVGKTPSQFDQHWMRMAYTGRASMPPIFTEVQQLMDFVANQANAVGVVAAGQENGSVKIISVK